MPVSTETFRPQRILHGVFAISAVILLGSVLWLIMADYNREWRQYQRQGRLWQAAMTTDAANAAMDAQRRRQLTQREHQIDELEAALPHEQIAQISRRIEEVTKERASLTLPAAAVMARMAPSAARERLLQRMLARIEHPELRERVHRELEGHDPASVIQATRALSGFSSHDWIGSVDVPTAVIVTSRDELVPPERQAKLAASIRGAEVFEVEGDHAACVARADLFVPALLAACRSVERRMTRG